jgi:hypothetical protein
MSTKKPRFPHFSLVFVGIFAIFAGFYPELPFLTALTAQKHLRAELGPMRLPLRKFRQAGRHGSGDQELECAREMTAKRCCGDPETHGASVHSSLEPRAPIRAGRMPVARTLEVKG